MKKTLFTQIEGGKGFYMLLAVLGAIILAGAAAVLHMEHSGHYVTGMNNQVVWGMPHVFAIFLIVAASGALNVASIGSVFGKKMYKPLAPLSGLLAIALLLGGLMILVLDLGRPDRLIVAMTHFNVKSIFTWNILLYNGFLAIVIVYLWTLMDKRMNRYSSQVGLFAFVWRLVLTTGTGSIFGFLVARQGYDAAIMAPMFVVMSFSFGLAIFLLVMMATYKWTNRPLGDAIVQRLKKLLGVFIAGAFYFVLVQHITNLYATEHHGVEGFVLSEGGIFTTLFWLGYVVLGTIAPLAIFFSKLGQQNKWVGIGSVLVLLGAIAQLYVIIIGGQAYPLEIYSGYDVVASSFADGQFNSYSPTLAETTLGFGGIAFALALVAVAVRNLRFLPESLADDAVDPHAK